MSAAAALLRWWLDLQYNYFIPEHLMGIQAQEFKIMEYRISEYTIAVTNTTNTVNTYANAGFVSRTESDTHADTFVAGKNCVPLGFSSRSCTVRPYKKEYEPIRNVPICTAATGYTAKTGLNYILVFPEALHMPDMEHSLFNPNQLRHFGTTVQDNPYAREPMTITSAGGEFTACMESDGLDIFVTTWAPSEAE